MAPDVLAFCPRCQCELNDPAAEPGDVCVPCALFILTWRLQMPYSLAIGRAARATETEQESAARRRRQALAYFEQAIEIVRCEPDPDVIEQVYGAVDDVLWAATHQRRRAAGRQPR